MARIRFSLLFFVGFAALMSIQVVSGAADTPAPYIYYYANTINAIVVERADGTDSRVIAPGAMPKNNEVITDLAWSSSGEWMAWRSRTYSGDGGAIPSKGWIARSDGSERLTWLDGHTVGTLLWSPIDDLLFAAYSPQDNKIRFMIIDVNANKIIAQTDYEQEHFGTYIEGPTSGWLADGSGVYFILAFEKVTLLIHLSITNAVSTRIFTPWLEQEGLLNITNGRMLSYDFHPFDDHQAQLTMQDLSSGKQVLIDSQPLDSLQQNRHDYWVLWDSTMRYAAIFVWRCNEGFCYAITGQLYLLDWEKGRLQIIADRIFVPTNEHYNNNNNPDLKSLFWSPNGNYALLRDEDSRLMVLDARSGQLFPRIDIADVDGWDWVAEADVLLLHTQNSTVYRYDLTAKTLMTVSSALIGQSRNAVSVSPDGHFLTVIGGDHSLDMLDLTNGQEQVWARHTQAVGPIVSNMWDSSSQWFMTGEYTTRAGGGSGESAVIIHNTTNTIRREISVCGYLGTCAGFVPERIIPHLGDGSVASVIPEPEYTLDYDGLVTGVVWSPDGRKIASYNDSADYLQKSKISIWDVSGSPELIHAYETDFNCETFPMPCKLSWSADGKTIQLTNYEKAKSLDVETGTQTDVPAPAGGFVLTSSDSQAQFIGNADGTTTVKWDGHDEPLTLTAAISNNYSADVRPDGKYIFGASLYHRIYVWDAATNQPLPDLNWYATGIALSPDGTRLAAAGSSLVTIWDVSDLGVKGS